MPFVKSVCQILLHVCVHYLHHAALHLCNLLHTNTHPNVIAGTFQMNIKGCADL